jgi:hypothetical protein
MRRDALSLGEIAGKLPISVSTARRWTLDIELNAEQKSAIRQRARAPFHDANAAWCEARRDDRRRWQAEGRARAQRGELLHQAGCLLYWAEGSKSRNRVQITNSDVHLLRLFRRFLSKCFGLGVEQLDMSVHVYLGNGLTIEEIEKYWVSALELDRTCLRTPQINKRPAATSGSKANKLPYGVASLCVARSTWLVQHIYGAIQEYGDFNEPRWLDMSR